MTIRLRVLLQLSLVTGGTGILDSGICAVYRAVDYLAPHCIVAVAHLIGHSTANHELEGLNPAAACNDFTGILVNNSSTINRALGFMAPGFTTVA